MTTLRTSLPDFFLEQLAILESVSTTAGDDLPLVYPKAVHVKNITKPFINMSEVVGTGLYGDKAGSGETPWDTIYQGYDKKITPTTKGLGLKFPGEAIDDDDFKVLAQAAYYLGLSGDVTVETDCARMFWGGFDTTYYTLGNGQALFSLTHPLPRGGTVANRLSNHVDPTWTGFQNLLLLFRSMTNISGIHRKFEAKQVIFPSALEYKMTSLLKSELRFDTDTNEINSISAVHPGLELVRWDYLDDGNNKAFYISAGPDNIKVYLIMRMMRKIVQEVSETHWTVSHIARIRYKESPYSWEGLVGSAGTS